MKYGWEKDGRKYFFLENFSAPANLFVNFWHPNEIFEKFFIPQTLGGRVYRAEGTISSYCR